MTSQPGMHASHPRRCAALSAAITTAVFSDETPSAMFMDLDQLAATIQHIKQEAGYPSRLLPQIFAPAPPCGGLCRTAPPPHTLEPSSMDDLLMGVTKQDNHQRSLHPFDLLGGSQFVAASCAAAPLAVWGSSNPSCCQQLRQLKTHDSVYQHPHPLLSTPAVLLSMWPSIIQAVHSTRWL